MAKYYANRGLEQVVEIEADSVVAVTDDGQTFELQVRRSDGEVSLNTLGRLTIHPRAANVVRLEDSHRARRA